MSERNEDAVIVLDHVQKAFGSFVAVYDADFAIQRGEFFSMLGPSGCGKTTTLRMIAGFEQPTSGRILLEGQDVSSVPPYRRHVNTVFQQYALFPHMTVFDNVAFGPRSRKVNETEVKARVNEMLEVVRLNDFVHRKPAQLSGGQQQRVALARALVNLPSALLLDEPLGALDLKLRQAMQIELKRIQRDVGITFVFVTHDQEEALTMSDRIAVMSQGHVEQIGTPEDIYHRPSSVFVAGFIGTANLMPCSVLSTSPELVVELRSGVRVRADFDGVQGFSAGERATLMLRPEHLMLTSEEPAAGFGVRAKITDLIFQGSVVRTLLRTPDDAEIMVLTPAGPDAHAFRQGDEVWGTWKPGAPFLLHGVSDVVGATTTDVDEVEASL